MTLVFWMFMALLCKGMFYGTIEEGKHYRHDR